MGYTHYCTSATEPTGRPGEEDRWASARQEHESLKAIVDQERNPQAVRPLGPDEAWPNSPAVPTASGATNFGGDVQMTPAKDEPYKNTLTPPLIPSNPASGATRETLTLTSHDLAEAFLRWPLPETVCADLCATKQGPGRVGTNLLSYSEAKQMFEQLLSSPASRPVVAQEGVRDTEMSQVMPTESGYYWMRFYLSGTDSSKLIQLRESSNGLEMLCESGGWAHISNFEKCFFSKKLVDPFSAMSSQPEGRG